ncbi:MAG: hypothetical protein KA099_11540 [Alphaproteobacteria bacterium]|nr:hypothetical protein [Alphaproteobacteria bacterium]MBP7760115.1 hypothetical protein [Alphaproteobacteria bacterium]MBP7763476.1 hypothetical protein [Alphaproteobacteria bacterium]MBP7905944.1 hypothetical protein [Alphaproteobacteria bacterium]
MRLALIISLAFFFSSHAWAGEHFENAKKLYGHGPSQAKAIIKELELELEESPENHEALMLLATTQRGVGDFKASQISLGKAESVLYKKGTIYPRLYKLKIENHLFMKEYDEAEKILTFAWALFQGEDELKKEYEVLKQAISQGKTEKKNLSLVGYATDYILYMEDRSILGWVFIVIAADSFSKVSNDKDLGVAVPIAQLNNYDTFISVDNKKDGIRHFIFFVGKELKGYFSSRPDEQLTMIAQPVPTSKPILYEPGITHADDGTPLSAYKVIEEGRSSNAEYEHVVQAREFLIAHKGLSPNGVLVPIFKNKFDSLKEGGDFSRPISLALENGYDAIVLELPERKDDKVSKQYVFFKVGKKVAYANSNAQEKIQSIEP